MCRVARSPEGWSEVEDSTDGGWGVRSGVGRAPRAWQAVGRTGVHLGKWRGTEGRAQRCDANLTPFQRTTQVAKLRRLLPI